MNKAKEICLYVFAVLAAFITLFSCGLSCKNPSSSMHRAGIRVHDQAKYSKKM